MSPLASEGAILVSSRTEKGKGQEKNKGRGEPHGPLSMMKDGIRATCS
jgi:hypothetical protein